MRKFFIPLVFLLEGCDLQPILVDAFSFSKENSSSTVSENTSYGEPRSTAKSYGLPKEKANPDIYGTNEPNIIKKDSLKKSPDSHLNIEKNIQSVQSVDKKESVSQAVSEKLETASVKIDKIESDIEKEKIQNEVKIIEENKINSNISTDNVEKVKEEIITDKIKSEIKTEETEKLSDNSEIDDILIVPVKNKLPVKTTIANPSVDTITVKSGDTLYSLSKQYNFIMRDLIELNELQAPFILKVGTVLKIPNLAFHTVVKGDTLYSISRQYKLDINNLAKLNNLTEPYSLKLGQKLRLSAPISTTGKLVQPESIAVTKSVEKPTPVVKSEKLKSEEKKETPRQEEKIIKKESKKTENKTTQTKEPKKEVKQPTVKSEIKSIAKPDSRSSSLFSWPVKGKIVSSFGTKANGLYNDGINISAKFGTPVLSAENGVVAYAGNEIRGLGNLVIIQHANSWMTVYAHMNDLKVSRGKKVKVGEVIGSIGQTGRVNSPQLHFEIRKDTRAFNPIKQLKPK